jgi:hypothetical protein
MSKLHDLIKRHRAQQSGNDSNRKIELFGCFVTNNELTQLLREIDGTTRGVPPREIGSTTRAVAQR